jgi:hypothetical protein
MCRNSQKALIAQRLRTASPATLRQQAAISRELGSNVQLFVATGEALESQKPGPETPKSSGTLDEIRDVR